MIEWRSTRGGAKSETIFYVNTTGSTELYLEVYGQNGAVQPNYSIRVDALPTDDSFEPNNGPLNYLSINYGTRYDNLICREDDWYIVNIPSGVSTIDVLASFQTQSGALHMEVYKRDGAVRCATAAR